jgi:hypothetical protein
MTYGLVLFDRLKCSVIGEAVSHSAELVRGDCVVSGRPPHPPLRCTFSPRGEGNLATLLVTTQ